MSIIRKSPLGGFLAILLASLPLAAAPGRTELLAAETEELLKDSGIEAPEIRDFRHALLGSEEWQHEIFDSGPVKDPGRIARVLFGLWLKDPQLADDPIDRGMAVACALEAADREAGTDEMWPRYQFFRDRHDAGLLNVVYDDLSVFERRFLARGVQHVGFNSLESLDYFNQEVCLPAESYPGSCWYARWIDHNVFGDTVQGPLYYAPFQNSWGSHAEMVRNVGGVCGSLSNFGAGAALANGVPAVTMGEPGHCAYAVRTGPKHWQPAYSLHWRRGMHTSFYGDDWGWHRLTTEAQMDVESSRECGDLRRLAAWHQKNGNFGEAKKVLAIARGKLPADWANWTQTTAFFNENKASESDWQDLHREALATLAPLSPEVAFHLLTTAIYPRLLPKGADKAGQRARILFAYHEAFADWGLARWDYADAVKKQLALLDGTPDDRDAFLARVAGEQAGENLFTGDILALQIEETKDQPERLRHFLALLGEALGKGRGDGKSDVIETLAAAILPAAAARGDRETFQFIGKMTVDLFEPVDVKVKPFPGILLSSGGTFGIQQPGNRWDQPARHWGVIEEHGGHFHTIAKPATATVQLGNFGRLSGVVIVACEGNLGRIRGAVLQASADGQTWTDLHTFEKAERVHRIDLRDRKIDAGYVRVIHPGNDFLHFNNLLVYGTKQN